MLDPIQTAQVKKMFANAAALNAKSYTSNATSDGILITMMDNTQFDVKLTALPYIALAMLSDSTTTDSNAIPASSRAVYLVTQMIQAIEDNYINNDRLTSVITGGSETLVATQKAVNELFKIINYVTTGMVYLSAITNDAFNVLNHGKSGNIYKAIEPITIGATVIPQNALIILKNAFENRLVTASDFDYFVGSESLHNLLDGLEGGDSVNNHYYHSDQPINKADTVQFATVNATTATITTVNATTGNFGGIKAGVDAPLYKEKMLTGTLNNVGGFNDVIHGLDQAKILSFTAMAFNTAGRWINMDTIFDSGSVFSCGLLGAVFRFRNEGINTVGRPLKILVKYEP